jgi:hypothetical protein
MNFRNPPCSGDTGAERCDSRELYGLEGKSLAMVYSPKQYWRKLYTPEDALMHGTLFTELNLPFFGEGGECR